MILARTSIAIALVFMAQVVAAGEMQFLRIDSRDCGLFESGAKPPKKLYPGSILKEPSTNEIFCAVKIPVAQFKNTYEFCALSSVINVENRVMCDHEYQDESKEEVGFMA